MAIKTNFTPEEWSRLLASPMVAGMAITAADPSGVWGLLKESMAAGWAVLEAGQNAQATPLVKAVAQDFSTAEGRTAARAALQTKFMGTKLDGLKHKACGFLDFGGIAVSESEKATLAELSAPLGRSGTAAT
jgi:hypothetical protein